MNLLLAALTAVSGAQGKPFDLAQGKPLDPAQGRPFELADGDRVALVGNSFFERDLRHNDLEVRLLSRFPGRTIRFRNLGWDGDTVFGTARAGFGSPEDGFRHLQKTLAEVKPTVILLAYGMNESFAGKAGLPAFQDGLHRLLESLAPLRARVVLLGPVRHEKLRPPLPDPEAHNRDLRQYADALAQAARSRGFPFLDLFDALGESTPGRPLTDDGLRLNAQGYRQVAGAVEQALGLPPRSWTVRIDVGKEARESVGTTLSDVTSDFNRVRFTCLDALLPAPGDATRVLYVRGLQPGRYALRAEDAVWAVASHDEWARGVNLLQSPELDQAEALRRAVASKNEVFFQYWRPQNDTYIFGFRKKEQGHLQPEFSQFAPILAQREARIDLLRVPQPRTYTLEPVKK
jgi:lysophospholipase L1-like esterase